VTGVTAGELVGQDGWPSRRDGRPLGGGKSDGLEVTAGFRSPETRVVFRRDDERGRGPPVARGLVPGLLPSAVIGAAEGPAERVRRRGAREAGAGLSVRHPPTGRARRRGGLAEARLGGGPEGWSESGGPGRPGDRGRSGGWL